MAKATAAAISTGFQPAGYPRMPTTAQIGASVMAATTTGRLTTASTSSRTDIAHEQQACWSAGQGAFIEQVIGGLLGK